MYDVLSLFNSMYGIYSKSVRMDFLTRKINTDFFLLITLKSKQSLFI